MIILLIPSLSLVGQNGDFLAGSSPGFGSLRFQTFPRNSSVAYSWICSPLQWRDRAGASPDFPIKPFQAPATFYLIEFMIARRK